MNDQCAFDQQQQEETVLFWAVSDFLNALDFFGIDENICVLHEMMNVKQKNTLQKILSSM